MIKYRIKLIKLPDEVQDNKHLTTIDENNTAVGVCYKLPTIGESLYLDRSEEMFINPYYTSTVTELLPNKVFKTLDGTYSYDIIEVKQEIIEIEL